MPEEDATVAATGGGWRRTLPVMSVDAIFERAGCLGHLHATTLAGAQETGVRADEPVFPASVIKVLVALTVESQVAEGRLEATERFRLSEPDRTPGPAGLSLFHDDVEISLRDLVTLVLTISDNVATDALIARVGLEAVNETASRLGLTATRMGSDLRTMIDAIAREAGFTDYAALAQWSCADEAETQMVEKRVRGAAALRPEGGTRTTARDMTRMLHLLWTDQAGPPEACARVRATMARQLTRNRLASGFGRGVGVAAKSGGLMGVVRNEIGAITFPDGLTCLVAVFTRTDTPADERLVNAAIGEAAAEAVALLRAA